MEINDQALKASHVFQKGAQKMIEGGVDPSAILGALMSLAVGEVIRTEGVESAIAYLQQVISKLEDNGAEYMNAFNRAKH